MVFTGAPPELFIAKGGPARDRVPRPAHSGSAQPVKLVITVNRDVIAVVITVEQSRRRLA